MEFSLAERGIYGVRGSCKVCRRIYHRQHNKDVRELSHPMRERNLKNRMTAIKKYLNTQAGRTKKNIIAKKQYEKHILKVKARAKVNYAIKRGKLIKGDCSYLKGKCIGRIEGHHWDYAEPLNVTWFCHKHHQLADNIQKLLLKII